VGLDPSDPGHDPDVAPEPPDGTAQVARAKVACPSKEEPPSRLTRRGLGRLALGGATLALNEGCARRGVAVEYDDGDDLSRGERAEIEERAEAAVRETRVHLPALPPVVALVVRKGKDVIPETGETASAAPPRTITWVVDPARGVLAVARAQLRATLHHELHHLVRDAAIPRSSLMDHVVAEGLATAFERDAASARPPWGLYPPEARAWVTELAALPPRADLNLWLYGTHADGRRWVGLRAGTWVADRAMRALGKTAAELVTEPTQRLIAAATAS
jgi:hypothetical protein